VDANCGYTLEETRVFLSELQRHGITLALLEQPVPREPAPALAALARETRVPVCADESARSAAEVLWLAQAGVPAINIKIMKSGVLEAIRMWHIARAAGMQLMIGGMVESRLAMSFSAHLASGLGGFDFIDLDTPMFITDDPFEGGFAQDGDILDITHINAGHGVRMRVF
jgi:L-alanine-DL-glutamate epimerase-like enolase superfamily enzyme